MAKRGEKFLEEERTHGDDSPGIIDDCEELERRLPPGEREDSIGAIPRAAFRIDQLQWTKERGGASVVRRKFAMAEILRGQKEQNTITATTCDIRDQIDECGDRLWCVTDSPVPKDRAHAEIHREPRGSRPKRPERDLLIEAWKGASTLLSNLRKQDPNGEPVVKLLRELGIEIHWQSGKDASLTRVVQVESLDEAARACVAAGISASGDAEQVLRELKIVEG